MNPFDLAKTKMQAAIEHFKNDLKGVRTGRANPAALDGVTAEVFGSPMKLKSLATVTAPEARQLLITPFDPKNASVIAKAIEKANLGLQPIVER